jgi:S-adenosylmethionine:tRNA ribosyltransferase-isomerase
MRLADFHYDLPSSAIAQEPISPRDHSKLMVLDRQRSGIAHKIFYEVAEFLKPGDVLVTNATKVFPARVRGRKKTGGKVDVLLLEAIPNLKHSALWGQSPISNVAVSGDSPQWRALVRGATKEAALVFPGGLEAQMTKRLPDGEWMLQFSSNHLRNYLDRHGEMPLPPYIKRPAPRAADLARYQTVYAQNEGAVAAPTAGFHFTPQLMATIRAKGVILQSIVLHVGWGTFRPVRTEYVERHKMLPERYTVSEETVRELNKARKEGRRIIAVGTTTVRTLETICDSTGKFQAGDGQSDLFIYPGYRFKAVDALITNFHLPDSTPLLLACAFYGQNPNKPFSLKPAYQEAMRQGYRFYSYGDAMFIQ